MLLAHIDLKGVLPRAEHLPRLLEDLACLGYDGVLVEYEDVFPFEGYEISAAPEEIWSRETLRLFLDKASHLGLEVVPLQQCLGHLEYVFRWEEWQPLALDQCYPSTLDVTNPDAKQFIIALLQQMLDAHPRSRFIHVGLDEAHALVHHAATQGRDVVELFLDHLEDICQVCEARGVTPLIFSDILENHFSAASLERLRAFRERVVLCPWDYDANGRPTTLGRINGNRAARAWLDKPQDAGAPALDAGTRWWEDLDEATREYFAPYFQDDHFSPLFWCDVWSRLGFRFMGVSAARTSTQGTLLPNYNSLKTNICAWRDALQRQESVLGHIISSWARGTTWCPPNHPFDLTWPLLQEAAQMSGKSVRPYFDGIDEGTLKRIFASLGRCREDWRIELLLADEMDALCPKAHAWEWRATALMARVLEWSRRAAFVQIEVDYFAANIRPVPQEWQRRINDQDRAVNDGVLLRTAVETHFSEHYTGHAFDEWLKDVFDIPMERIQCCREISFEKMKSSAAHYSRAN